MKNKIFAIIMMIALSMPVFAEPETTAGSQPFAAAEIPAETSTLPENAVIPENAPADVPVPIEYKQPMGRKKLAKMFIFAMLGVAVSSILLYVILTVYNKLRDSFLNSSMAAPAQNETSLDTPDNLAKAVKTFLDKTKW